jgi:hypothetical protein
MAFESIVSSTVNIVIVSIDSFILAIDNADMTLHPFAATPDSVGAFVADWHAGRVSRAAWTHGAHVAVCAWYAFANDADTTFAIVKAGILAFARVHGIEHTATSGYHETLTRFWTLAIAAHVRATAPADGWEAVCAALARFGDDRDLPRRAYSFDVVRDVRARAEWVPPDRAVDGLPFVA